MKREAYTSYLPKHLTKYPVNPGTNNNIQHESTLAYSKQNQTELSTTDTQYLEKITEWNGKK